MAEAAARLCVELAEAQELYELGDRYRRAGAIKSLLAVSRFIGAISSDTSGLYVMTILALAIGDLANGIIHPVLEPTKFDNRPGDTPERQALRIQSSATMDALMGLGISRAEASSLVHRALASARINPGGLRNFTPATVTNWRDTLRGKRAKEIEAQAYRNASVRFAAALEGATRDAGQRALLEGLKALAPGLKPGLKD